MDYLERWKFARDAFEGFDSSYLVQFSREHEDKYKNRQDLSYCVNYIKPKAKQFVSYLAQRRVNRNTNNNLLKLMINDVDKKGNSIDMFMQGFAINAKVRGANLCVVDMPKKTPSNLKDQIDTRTVPYFVEVLPENIHSYKLDEFGFFEWIIIELFIDKTEPFGNVEKEKIYRYYDKTEWKVLDKDEKVLESGVHNVGKCPIVAFSESGFFPNVGEFSQIADIQKRLMNLRSELDEILRGQTFSLLAYNIENSDDIEDLNVGVNNVLMYKNNPPSFIAPPDAPAKVYQDEINRLESLIEKIAHTDVVESTGVESGMSKRYRFQSLNSSLIDFSSKLESFERQCFDIACRWLEITNDVEISYPKDFNIKDIQSEIQSADALFNYNLGKTYESIKKEQLALMDLDGLEESQVEQIKKEIEELSQVRDNDTD